MRVTVSPQLIGSAFEAVKGPSIDGSSAAAM
jgi:hypothetical protein